MVSFPNNILCVDVEDWYHPEYVKKYLSGNPTPRIVHSVDITLDFLRQFNVKATFFIVGEIAEANPNIVKKIVQNNHEIAFHGYDHTPLWQLNPKEFTFQLEKYVSLIKKITGKRCIGFRAPSYSLDNRSKWAIPALEAGGFVYDSSIFPIKTPLYGVSSAPITPYYPSATNITQNNPDKSLLEFPALTYSLAGFKIPASGGFYLRSLPLFILKRAIRKMNTQGVPAVFTFHTWELDSGTPRLSLGLSKSFITYHNIPVTKKLGRLISSFSFTNFETYLRQKNFSLLD